MSDPYIGEIRIFAGNFEPAGWAFCDGQLLPISENETLFQLIGTTYGGDGQANFALPDLRSRLPIHQGTNNGITYILAESGGTEEVTLTTNQLPTHSHSWRATNSIGNASSPIGRVPAIAQGDLYTTGFAAVPMSPQAIGPTGGSQPHENVQPFLGLNFIISLFGIYPTQF